MNRVVKFLILSDFFIFSATGLLSPILAVFVTNQIVGGDLKVVGISSTVYLVFRAFLQLGFAKWIDKKISEKYDFALCVVGALVVSLTPIGFIFAQLPIHIYILEALNGIGFSMTLPAWYAIFTRHIDKGKEGFEWSASDTTIALGQAIAATVGGFLADKYGFNLVFIFSSALSFIGATFLIFIFKDLKNQKIVIPVLSGEDFLRPLKNKLKHKRIY